MDGRDIYDFQPNFKKCLEKYKLPKPVIFYRPCLEQSSVTHNVFKVTTYWPRDRFNGGSGAAIVEIRGADLVYIELKILTLVIDWIEGNFDYDTWAYEV